MYIVFNIRNAKLNQFNNSAGDNLNISNVYHLTYEIYIKLWPAPKNNWTYENIFYLLLARSLALCALEFEFGVAQGGAERIEFVADLYNM